MKKKLLSVLLCAAMAATMMTGCGTKEEPAAAPAEETSAPEADTSAAPADTTGSDEGSAEGKAYNIGYSNLQ